MKDLSPILPKLEKLIPRLASASDGEVVATARAIYRVLRGAGCDWHDLSAALDPARPSTRRRAAEPRPEPKRPMTWREIADWCALCPQAGTLSPKEMEFVLSMVRFLRRYDEPTGSRATGSEEFMRSSGGCSDGSASRHPRCA